MNNTSILNQKIEDCAENNSLIEFEYEEIYEHDFPIENKVPEDWYCSKIVDVKKVYSSNQKPCIDVYYKIVPQKSIVAYNEDYIDSVPYHFIIQRYVEGSIYYHKLCASMYSALKTKKFTHKDIIGVTENIHLTYAKDGAIGNITERKCSNIHPSFFEIGEEDTLTEEK